MPTAQNSNDVERIPLRKCKNLESVNGTTPNNWAKMENSRFCLITQQCNLVKFKIMLSNWETESAILHRFCENHFGSAMNWHPLKLSAYVCVCEHNANQCCSH